MDNIILISALCLAAGFALGYYFFRTVILKKKRATLLKEADLDVDLVRRKATRAGVRLDLTAKEFNLLALLLRRKGEVLSRTELASQVWDMNFDSETNVVEVAVRRLRMKVDNPFDFPLVHTVRGMWYVLERRDPS